MGCIACAALVFEGASVTLRRKESSSIPVEADSICPDRFVGRGQTEIAELPACYGRRKVTLGDLFEVEGYGADNVTVSGDLTAVAKIGQGMTHGRITVTGDVGPHLGAHMTGGEIVVQGAAGDLVGADMSGGLIVVHGDAGESAGAGMSAGTIVVEGRLGGSAGAGMRGGAIVVFGGAPELPPTFRFAGLQRPESLHALLPDSEAAGLVTSQWLPGGEFRRYVGDTNGGGTGEVLIRDQSE
jgi:formylmethanofuran dehydrogenase subunit C